MDGAAQLFDGHPGVLRRDLTQKFPGVHPGVEFFGDAHVSSPQFGDLPETSAVGGAVFVQAAPAFLLFHDIAFVLPQIPAAVPVSAEDTCPPQIPDAEVTFRDFARRIGGNGDQITHRAAHPAEFS